MNHELMAPLLRIESFLRSKSSLVPKAAVILGSGFGDLKTLDGEFVLEQEIPYGQIPDFPRTSVLGHSGTLILGTWSGVPVALLKGRSHLYEGYTPEMIVRPIRALKLWGIQTLILTNAAGGMDPQYFPGDLVRITNQINLTGQSPLTGLNDDRLGPRFPDVTYPYDLELSKILIQAADDLGLALKEGVYAGVIGPQYETAAEVAMLQKMGAQLVGMSTVMEVLAAKHMGLRVAGISCMCNLAAGLNQNPLSHDEISEVGRGALKNFEKLLTQFFKLMKE